MGYFGSVKKPEFDGAVFPSKGQPREQVMQQLEEFTQRDVDEVHGHTSVQATTQYWNLEVSEVAKDANRMFVHRNMLFRELLTGTMRMSIEVKQMVKEMLRIPEDTAIRFTTGGSESIYSGINAANQWGKKEKRIRDPEIVVPYTIHSAFSKWCHYAGIKIRRIPVGADLRADVSAIEDAITPNTILIAGSAPCWPYGLFDDIPALGEVAQRHDVWMHTDGCLGGFQSPFAEALGHELPTWDFRVPGVRSMSADLHKHAYATKSLSSVIFRNEEWASYHDVVVSDWPDGPYTSEAMAGSTTAGSIASAWAAMKFLGEDGYLDLVGRALSVRQRYLDRIATIDGIDCVESDLCTMLARSEKGLDVFAVMGGLFERKSFCLPSMQPPGIKLILDPVKDDVVDTFCDNLEEVIPLVRSGSVTIQNLKPWL